MTPELQEALKSLNDINQALLQQAMLDYPDHSYPSVKQKYNLEVSSITSLIEPIRTALQRLEKAEKLAEKMRWFCDRVDKGEVRSKRTYSEFKEALAEWEAK